VRTSLDKRLKELDRKSENLVEAVSDGLLSKDDIRGRREKIQESEEKVRERLAVVHSELAAIPGADKIEKLNMFKGRVAHHRRIQLQKR